LILKTPNIKLEIKELLKKVIPEEYRPVVKHFFRRIFYFGFKYICPLCHSSVRCLFPLGLNLPVLNEKKIIGGGYRLAMCPVCGSSDRERLLYLFLHQRTNIFSENIRLLHIAPEKNLKRIFANCRNINYLTADLNPEEVMVKMDVTGIQYPDDTFDAVICNHVLEHIIDDSKAMKELLRVLKPGGWAVLQVPVSLTLEKTFEDATVITPEERQKAFGQKDHVRIYGKDYPQRLRESGFIVYEFKWKEYPVFGGTQNKYVLNKDETIYFCQKN